MKFLRWLFSPVSRLYNRICFEIEYRRKLKELRKRDPFIYK